MSDCRQKRQFKYFFFSHSFTYTFSPSSEKKIQFLFKILKIQSERDIFFVFSCFLIIANDSECWENSHLISRVKSKQKTEKNCFHVSFYCLSCYKVKFLKYFCIFFMCAKRAWPDFIKSTEKWHVLMCDKK